MASDQLRALGGHALSTAARIMLTLLFAALLPAQEAPNPIVACLRASRKGHEALAWGNVEEARAAFAACLELSPRNSSAAYGAACAAARAKQDDVALDWLDRAVQWGYADAEVALWDADLATLRTRERFVAIVERMREAGKNRHGREIALKIWDSRLKGPLSEVAVDPAGRTVAVGDWGGNLVVLDARSGHEMRRLPSLGSEVWDIEFDPRGGRLVALTFDGRLHFVALDENPAIHSVRALPADKEEQVMPWSYGSKLRFDPTGELVLAAGSDRGASVWTAKGEPVWSSQEAFGYFFQVELAWTADGKRIAAPRGTEVRFLDARTGASIEPALACPDSVRCVAVQPGGRLLATGHARRRVRVWDLETRDMAYADVMQDEFGDAMGTDSTVNAAQFSPDGKYLAYSMVDSGFVVVIEAATGKRVWNSEALGGRLGEPTELCFSPDGRRLWHAMASGVMHVYEVDLRTKSVDVLTRGGCPEGSPGGIAAFEIGYAVVGLDMSTGTVLWQRPQLERAGEILCAPSGHFAGDIEDLDGLHVVIGTEGEGESELVGYALEYFDPKRVLAARAGVRLVSRAP